MNNSDQPGYLGHKFDDQPAPLPTHLDWDTLGDGIIMQQPRRRRWPLFLFFLLGMVTTAAWLVNRSTINLTGTFPLPVLHAGNEQIILPSESVLLTKDAVNQIVELATDLSGSAANADSKKNLDQLSIPAKIVTPTLVTPAGKSSISYTSATRATGKADIRQVTTRQRRVTDLLVTPFLMVELEDDLDLNVAKLIASTAKKPSDPSSSVVNKTGNTQLVFLAGTGNHTGNIDAGTSLYTSYFSARYRRLISNRWYGGIGLTSRRFVRGSQLNSTEELDLFRPGTVDTIFRNIDTGAERIVTTDTIAGLRTTAFTGYSRITLLTLPISIGWHTPALGGDLGWEVGLAPGLTLNKSGRVLTNNGEIVSTTDQSNWQDRWYLGLDVGINYGYAINSRISLQSSIGTSYLVRPQLMSWNFSLGIGYRW